MEDSCWERLCDWHFNLNVLNKGTFDLSVYKLENKDVFQRRNRKRSR